MADTFATGGVPPAIPDSAARSDAAGAISARDREAERGKLKQLAQEFEAMLMNEMLGAWRRSLVDDEAEGGGLGSMTDMAGSELGRALSRSGGLGIAAVLERAFERQQSAAADSPAGAPGPIEGRHAHGGAVPGQAASAAVTVARSGVTGQAAMGTPSVVEMARDARPAVTRGAEAVGGTVTSPYGWRPDPFTGRSKFHAGVDVRMAYGQEVSSVASGRVSFSGVQGSYGLTVIVDHGDGLQTRYAHLSGSDVQAGDEVRGGQAIARAGSSGRSTGPHLHVEVLRHGRSVDPAGLLKGLAGSADWEAYRSPSNRGQD